MLLSPKQLLNRLKVVGPGNKPNYRSLTSSLTLLYPLCDAGDGSLPTRGSQREAASLMDKEGTCSFLSAWVPVLIPGSTTSLWQQQFLPAATAGSSL